MNAEQSYVANLRAATSQAIGIGEVLQARIDAACDELALEERQLADAELLALLRGTPDAV